MDYTHEQLQAIYTHDRNVIVIAGAGSGKTRVLVDRFVALLEANPHWPLASLVAITFTEKAAREMRDRVRQAVEARIAACGPEQLSFWRAHQAALDSARIGTIHSLCAMLLRANAANLGIDPGFTLLDEAEAAVLRDEAIEQALGDLLGTAGAALFEHYDSRTVWNTVRAMLEHELSMWAEKLSGEVSLIDHWRALYAQNAAECLYALRSDAEFVAALRWQPASQPAETDKLYGIWLRIQALTEPIFEGDVVAAYAALEECCSTIKVNVGAQKAWNGQVDEAKAALRTARDYAAWAVEQMGQPPGEADALAAELVPLWINAIQSAQTVYRDYKAQQRALDFADLERMACDLLRDERVQARYQGTEFNHVLVDEFQDTNAAQRDIIYSLTGNQAGRLFVVGDPKQSIYAFRGADVSVFEQVRHEITEAGGLEIALNTSFRAHRALVNGLNAVFSRLLVKSEDAAHDYQNYTIDYGLPMIAYRDSTEYHDPVFDVIMMDKERVPKDERSADRMRRWEAQTLAKHIREMVADGWPVWDKAANTYRPITFGDFAVLFQATSKMPLVEDVFKATGVRYVTIAGKGYYNRPEVWDLLNLLKALYNPDDALSLASALRSPLYNLSDDALYALRLLTSSEEALSPHPSPEGERNNARSVRQAKKAIVPLWDALMDESLVDLPDAEQIAFARGSLKRLRALAGRVTIAELLSHTIEDTAYMATLTGLDDGARRCGNVEKLLDVARRSKRVSLGDFTAYLQDLSERETREGEAPIETEGAVRLMTVHASKGLEFPVVVLFDATWKNNERGDWLLIDPLTAPVCKIPGENGTTYKPFAYQLATRRAEEREAAERLRLFYVGATRAQDRLIVTGHELTKEGTWLRQLQAVLDLSTGEDETQTVEQEWGSVKVTIPRTPPDPDRAIPSRPLLGWDTLDGAQAEPVEPLLLTRPATDRHAPTRILNASEVALLGEVHAEQPTTHQDFARFRHHVLRDAPPAIHNVADSESGTALGVSASIIGEMVHKALQYQGTPGDLHVKLRTYAWEQGVTDLQNAELAVLEAAELLHQTEQRPFMQRLQQATKVYRELPFTLQREGRTINGQIDVLYLSYGKWTVLDYKTDQVEEQFVHSHSRRHHMQVGIYAAAVEELTGQAPDVYLHYIRTAITIQVSESQWRAALAALETNIDAALDDGVL